MKSQSVIFEKPIEHPADGPLTSLPKEAMLVNNQHWNHTRHSSEEILAIQEHSQRFEKLLEKSERVLLKTKAVFPFEIFPDDLIIDENKVTIIHRYFFWITQIQSIPISHIQDVEVDTALLFATLKILPLGYSVISYTENWVNIEYLWRNDAIRARRIIDGLLIGNREGIDFSKVETPNFVQKVEALGKV